MKQQPDSKPKTFGFLIFPGVEELDFVGPWEMAAMWSAYAEGPERLVTVAPEKGPLRAAKGLGMIADHNFSDCPPLDYFLVPGGFAVFDLLEDEAVVGFIRERAQAASHVLSVCSGAFLLHRAGLLEGRTATTHWKVHDAFGKLPGVKLKAERWVRDDTVWTSAGVSAGIDMTLAFIAAVGGEAAASHVQMNAEYYPEGKLYGHAHETLAHVDYLNTPKAHSQDRGDRHGNNNA